MGPRADTTLLTPPTQSAVRAENGLANAVKFILSSHGQSFKGVLYFRIVELITVVREQSEIPTKTNEQSHLRF